jgi:hypothetical protein
MTNHLKLTIEGFSNLESHGNKGDGSPDVRRHAGYRIRLDINGQRILFEETLAREKLPVNPTRYLSDRMANILAAHLPTIDPA